MKYSFNTECGHMVIEAESIEKAKQVYAEKFHYDFSACDEVDGSWYRITNDETGEVLEFACLQNMPS